MIPAGLEVRFWSYVPRGNPDACWEWSGTRSPLGYGEFRWGLGKRGLEARMSAHRVAWELTRGAIPDGGDDYHGWCVLHRCDNPPCVNPAHLFLGTHTDNMRDAQAKGRIPHLTGPVKIHCKRGHEFSPENTRMYYHTRGLRRICRACKRERQRVQSPRPAEATR